MQTRSLRHILSTQSILTSTIPFIILALLVIFWLLPRMLSDMESHQRELTDSISSQIDSYLTAAMTTVRGSAQIHQDPKTADHIQTIMDALLNASDSIGVIYAADRDGQISAVGLPQAAENRKNELSQMNISRNSFFKKALQSKTPLWSDTFLSLISGRLSVAYVVPFNDKIITGEIRLDQLTQFLKSINEKNRVLILVIDNNGRVIAGHDQHFTAQQLNISNIPIVKPGLSSQSPLTGRFMLEGQSMIGSVVNIPSANWGVLVAQPVETAYQTVWLTTGIIAVAFITAILLGITIALFMAGRLAASFEELATHAGKIVDNGNSSQWPDSNISEFRQLAEVLSHMSDTLCYRENELRTSKEYSENLIKAANMIIIGLDGSDCVTMMNHTAEAITGYTLAELKGRHWFQTLVPENVFPEVYVEFERIKGKNSSSVLENPILTKNGEKRIIYWHNNPILENDQVAGIISFGSDITEQRILEQQLIQAQKMESIGRLAGGVAHDFNNKLTVILGYAEILKMSAPEDGELWQDLNEISEAAGHSREITAQLLAFSRQQIISPRPIDLNSTIKGMQRTLPRLIGEDILLTLELAPDLWLTSIDPTQMDQIIMNLAVNSRDAMADGGELKISTTNTTIDKYYCHEHMEAHPGDYVMILIQDNGCGMDRETQRHVFEPFFTTKQLGKGTGLGLATIYGIVTQNNGFINLYSEPGLGTTFKVYLPRLENGTLHENRASAEKHTGSGKVMLVEDDITVRRMTKMMLEQIGYTVTATDNPQQAISLCTDFKNDIDLIITDVIMPGMNGKEMIDAIENIRPDMRVLYMSGYTSEIISQKGVIEENMFFIQKPFDMSSLNSKIKQALA